MTQKQLIRFALIALSISFCLTQAQAQTPDDQAKRHDELMQIIMTKPRIPIKTIGVFVYDGYNTLDAIGPYQVLSELMGVDIFFVAKERGVVKNQRGLKVQVDKSFADVDKLDILVIPGGAKETFMQTQDTTVLNWIRKIDRNSVYTTSVCTGGWIVAGQKSYYQLVSSRGGAENVRGYIQTRTLRAGRQILDIGGRFGRYRHGPGYHERPDGREIHQSCDAGPGIRPQADLQSWFCDEYRSDCGRYDDSDV